MSLIALESQRNKCMVIGEDLGTVPEGLRQRMHDAKLFGCSILYFERGEGGTFRAPAAAVARGLSDFTVDVPARSINTIYAK